MKNIKTYEEFINEENKDGFLYRNTHPNWLIELLKKGKIKADKDRFISFSADSDSGGQDDYGSMRVEFNIKEMESQGVIEIEYDSYFFDDNPKVSMYVSGYNNEEDYYDNQDFDDAEEAHAEFELSWEEHVEDFAGEEEWIMDSIKFNSNLINHVTFKKNTKLQKLLDENKVEYTIN
jgi:hypothetical protein|tara:strand:- start:442 stop:972 length:531 start_codon:yes stop_codon:yes gene_type:complete